MCFRELTDREYSLATQWEIEQKRWGRRVTEAERNWVLLYSLGVVFFSLFQNGLNSLKAPQQIEKENIPGTQWKKPLHAHAISGRGGKPTHLLSTTYKNISSQYFCNCD